MKAIQIRPALKIERLPEVLEKTGLSKSTLYLRIQQGLFVNSIQLGGRAVGWNSQETDAMLCAMIAGYAENELKRLVTDLKTQRTIGRLSTSK